MSAVCEDLKPVCLNKRKFKGFSVKGWGSGENEPLGCHMNGKDIRKI